MKFSEFPYVRPDVTAICSKLAALTDAFSASQAANEQISLVKEYRDLLIDLNSMRVIASIRYTINTEDAFYKAENDFFSANNPTIEKSIIDFGLAVLKSSFIPALKKEFGDIFITNLEFKSRSMTPEIITLMQEENDMVSQYHSFNARAKVPFRGTLYTVPAINTLMNDDDRATRKAAYTALSDFYCANKDFYDNIYDKMVKNRTEQAHKMGFDSYTQLGYIRRNRNCYTPEEVAVFRAQIRQDIVPAIVAMKKRQAERIHIPDMKIYDQDMYFADGNPKTFSDYHDMMNATQEAFSELSPITKEFIELMMKDELYDAPSRPGKRVGAYSNAIPAHKSPFVFLNYAGSASDITTTFHEFGHAFNGYLSRNNPNAVLQSYTLDTAEIHSMSMEFMSEPVLYKFFSPEDLCKQKQAHLEHCLTFLSYGTMVDHFQHIMYDQPNLTPTERNQVWRDLETQYRPYMDFDDIEYYETGRRWQCQQHIFANPFYYIDYVLAQTIALQFWQIARSDHDAAFAKYVQLTRKGGELTFTDLVRSVGLKVPFEPGALKAVRESVEEML